MDLELLEKGVEYAKQKRRWVVLFGFTCYGAYKIYNFPCVVKKRQSLSKFLAALVSVAETVSHSAGAIGIISKDLKQFLGSDSDQIPQSLKQLSKIATSNEFSDTLTSITRASAVGILSGSDHHGFSDSFMNKLFSDAGAGFASAVVGSFARNTVNALFSEWQQSGGSKSDDPPWWIEVACEDKCRELVGHFIRLFVSTAVTVYLDKTTNVNTYDHFFIGLTNPKHEAKVRDMLASVCNAAVETCLRTSYHVWTTNSAAAVSKLNKTCSKMDLEDGFGGDEKGSIRAKLQMKRVTDRNQMRSANRRFVLDMTGVVTFETVRSFLEFMLEKMSEGIKTSVDVVQQEVVDKGVEAMRYASGRSSAVTAVCLTLCLNILNSPWILVPYYY